MVALPGVRVPERLQVTVGVPVRDVVRVGIQLVVGVELSVTVRVEEPERLAVWENVGDAEPVEDREGVGGGGVGV